MRARDAEHVGDLLRNQVGTVPGVRSTRTTIVLGSMKESPRLPVRVESEDEELVPALAQASAIKGAGERDRE
jgi:hypothetical protein